MGEITTSAQADVTLNPGIYYGNGYPAEYQNHIIIVLKAAACYCQIAIMADTNNSIKYRVIYNRNSFSGVGWKSISLV